ncbi:MAG: hypothetical protein LBH70_08975 [Spirochaetaceae bacterium]|jgi:hypothetical protein|nr:hypothetical protein [Spirochaetaceae bacterium]
MTLGKLNGFAETALEWTLGAKRSLRPFGLTAVMEAAPVLYTDCLSVTEIGKIEAPGPIYLWFFIRAFNLERHFFFHISVYRMFISVYNFFGLISGGLSDIQNLRTMTRPI